MSNVITFSAIAGAESIYKVHDNLSGVYSIGKVGKCGKYWLAAPSGETFDGPRQGFSTRRDAAYRLARYCDSVRDGKENRDWIY